MTFSEALTEYWPSVLIGLEETGTTMLASTAICLLVGLPLDLGLFLANPKVKGHQPWLYWVSNFIVTVIHSFPYLLFVVASIPATRPILGKAFGSIPSSVSPNIVTIVIFTRLVEQVLLDVSEEVYSLINSLGTSKVQYIWHSLLTGERSGLILAYATTTVSMVLYSAVTGVAGGGGIGDFAVRAGYRRYEYSIMYVVTAIMITLVFILQMLGNFITQKLDKRK